MNSFSRSSAVDISQLAEYVPPQPELTLCHRSDVLLPLTVYLIIIHEHDFAAKASKTLIEEGESSPTEDDIALKAFELADAEFDRGSVTKAGEWKRLAFACPSKPTLSLAQCTRRDLLGGDEPFDSAGECLQCTSRTYRFLASRVCSMFR